MQNIKREYSQLKKDLMDAFHVVRKGRGMGGFILGLCSIDWMASYYFARDTRGDEYKEFARMFLPKYHAEQLWSNLRCRLVHNFTNRGDGVRYDFREDASYRHLQLRPIGKSKHNKMRVINLSNFVADLESALNALFGVLERNPEMMRRAVQRRKDVGLIVGRVQTD